MQTVWGENRMAGLARTPNKSPNDATPEACLRLREGPAGRDVLDR